MPVPATSRLQRYFTVIVRWFVILGLAFCATVLIGRYISGTLLPQQFRATAQLQIQPRGVVDTSTPVDQAKADQASTDDTSFRTELATMQSADFLLPIIHDLSLDSVWATRFKSKEDKLSENDAVARLKKMVELAVVRETNLVNVTIVDDDATEAARIANAISDRYRVTADEPVTIISKAEVPTKTSHRIAEMALIVFACIVSILAASFTEMILLFQRAGERNSN